jgi:fructosamine-3-kinase
MGENMLTIRTSNADEILENNPGSEIQISRTYKICGGEMCKTYTYFVKSSKNTYFVKSSKIVVGD